MTAPAATARRPQPVWLLTAGALALAGWLGWQLYGPSAHGDPLATSLLALERQNRLTVFSAQLSPVVAAEDVRAWGMLQSRQVAVIPARVEYTVDLARLDRKRLRWDRQAQRLDVVLPPLQVSRPNLDEGRAQYLREGVWITGAAQASLTRENTLLAEQQAAQQAQAPVLMDLARAAARQAVRQNLQIPLQVAGYEQVEVTVRFDAEQNPP